MEVERKVINRIKYCYWTIAAMIPKNYFLLEISSIFIINVFNNS